MCHLHLIAISGLSVSFIHNASIIHMYTVQSFIIFYLTSIVTYGCKHVVQMF